MSKGSRPAQKLAEKSAGKPPKKSAAKKENQFARRMLELLGSEAELNEFLEHLRQFAARPPRALRSNPLRASVDEFWAYAAEFGIQRGAEVAWEKRANRVDLGQVSDVATLPLLGAGLCYIQEPGAMEAVHLLDPQPGEKILDLCAAPGGKATQIGERLAGRGWLVANEPVRSRAERLDLLLARQGILNASVYALDPSNLSERYGAYFDRILVDAPCSGESLFAKRQDFRTDVRDVDVSGCARRQFTILARAAEMLKAGGTLVYSTCTYSREENEDVVRAFLENFPLFELESEHRRWPHRDQVAGGYAARLRLREEQPGVQASTEAARGNTAGLIRHGWRRWNAELDDYAFAMRAQSTEVLLASAAHAPVSDLAFDDVVTLMASLQEQPSVRLESAAARAYLRGESFSADATALHGALHGAVRVLWRDYPLGLGRAVDGRVNNLLPKILRGQA